jgi:hypothetical protein
VYPSTALRTGLAKENKFTAILVILSHREKNNTKVVRVQGIFS